MMIYVPAVPAIQRAFASDMQLVQLTLSLPLLAVVAAPAIAGWLADRFGRRPVLLGSVAILIGACLLALVADTLWSLLAARIAMGIAGTCSMVAARAVVADSYPASALTAAMARYAAAPILAMMVAPTIGGAIVDGAGWRGVFVFPLAFGACLLALASCALHETAPIGADRRMDIPVRGFGPLLRLAGFWGYVWQSAFHFAVAIGFVSAAPYLVSIALGRTATAYGIGLAGVIFGMLLGVLLALRLGDRVSRPMQVVAGSGLGFAASLILPVLLDAAGQPLSPLLLFGPTALVAFGIGLALPAGQAAIVGAVPTLAGTASGISSCTQLVMAAAAVHLAAVAWPRPELALALIVAAGMALALGCALVPALIGNRRPRR